MAKKGTPFIVWDGDVKVACPKCGDGHQIDVQALIYTRITLNGTDTAQSGDGSEEYTSDHNAICRACGHEGLWGDFSDYVETEEG